MEQSIWAAPARNVDGAKTGIAEVVSVILPVREWRKYCRLSVAVSGGGEGVARDKRDGMVLMAGPWYHHWLFDDGEGPGIGGCLGDGRRGRREGDVVER